MKKQGNKNDTRDIFLSGDLEWKVTGEKNKSNERRWGGEEEGKKRNTSSKTIPSPVIVCFS